MTFLVSDVLGRTSPFYSVSLLSVWCSSLSSTDILHTFLDDFQGFRDTRLKVLIYAVRERGECSSAFLSHLQVTPRAYLHQTLL